MRNQKNKNEPSIVYAYLSAEYALSDIAHQHLKLTEAQRTNDPFEYHFEMAFHMNERFKGEFDEMAEKWYSENIEANAERMPFVCFSDSFKNLTMWAHYRKRHAGVCLGFDRTALADSGCGKVHLSEVSYPPRPLSCPVPNRMDNAESTAFLEEMFTTKRGEWSVEREWRLSVPIENTSVVTDKSGIKFFKYPKGALKEIDFGIGCPDEEIGILLLTCVANDLSVNAYRMKRGFKRKTDKQAGLVCLYPVLKREKMSSREKNRCISKALLSDLLTNTGESKQ